MNMDTIHFREILNQMQTALECSICLELLNNPVSTKCDHQFCRFCIIKFLESKRSVPCPLCKVPVTKRSLQERSELSVVISNVQKLIAAFDRDTDMGQEPVLDSTSENSIAGASGKQKKADKTQRKSSIQPGAVNNDLCYDHGKTLVLEKASDEQLHKCQSVAMVPTTKSRYRFKPDSTTFNTASSVLTEDLKRKRRNTGVMPDINKRLNRDSIAATQRKYVFEPASSENGFGNLILGQAKKAEKSIILYDKCRVEPCNNEHKHDTKNKDLLNYLEEGSCGAVIDGCPAKKNTKCEPVELSCGDLKKNTSKTKMSNFNEKHDYTIKNLQRPIKITPDEKDDNHSEALDNDCNNKSLLRFCSPKLPLSPSKANTLESNSCVPLDNLSILVNNEICQDSEAKENALLIKESELKMLPGLGNSCSISGEMGSPEVSSLSSTQQLMKSKPVTARTYSRDMRKSYYTGYVKNWADTLPHQPEGQKQLNQNRGLTTKEKINAKKNKKFQPSKNSQADVITPYKNADKCLSVTDTVSRKEDVLKLNESSQVQFELPLTPVPRRRRSIFKSHVQSTDSSTRASDTKILHEEDPYDFKVGQTPVKPKRKISGRKCGLRTNTSKEIVEVIGGQGKSNKSKLKTVASKQIIPLDMFVSHTLPLLEDSKQIAPLADACIGNMVSDVCVSVPDTPDKQETSHSHVQNINVPNAQKIVHFSSDFDLVNVGVRNRYTRENEIGDENLSVVKTSTIPNKADIDGVTKNQNHHCRFSDSEIVQLNDAYIAAQNTSAAGTVSKNMPETSSKIISDLENTDNLFKSTNFASKNIDIEIFENTGNLQTFVVDSHLGQPLNMRNQQIRKTDNLYDTNAESLVTQSKRMQKRRFARKKQKTCENIETFSQKSGKELTKLIDKINEAEDYELMFNTQDVQQKLQEGIEKEQLHSEAFGFDLLDSEISNVTDTKDKSECETAKLNAESTCDQISVQDDIHSFALNDGDMSMQKVVMSLVTKKEACSVTNVLQMAMENVKSGELKIVDFVKETPFSEDTSSSDTAKNAATSVKGNITVGANRNIISSSTDATEICSLQCFSDTHQPKQNFSSLNEKYFSGPRESRRRQYFSRPNISEMILVSPIAKITFANTGHVGSSNGGLELGSSILDGMPHKISRTVEIFSKESQLHQHGDDSNQNIKNKHNSNEQGTLDLHHASCTQDVTIYPHSSRDVDETQKPLSYNPVISPTYVKQILDGKISVDAKESMSKISHSVQLSLKSNNALQSNDVSKSYNVPNNKSTELTNDASGSDVILAPDTWIHSYGCTVVIDDSEECSKKKVDCVVETLDFDASNDESANQIEVNSPSRLKLNESGQTEMNNDALADNRTCVEAIVDTQCLSNQSTVGFTAASLESVSEKCDNNTYSYDLNGRGSRTKTECPQIGTHIDFDTSHNAKTQPIAVADTSQETVSGCSAQSQYILLPEDKKIHVSEDHNDNLSHPSSSFSEHQTQLSIKQQFAKDNMSSNETVPETPYATISPKNKVSSAPDRLHVSESEDEDRFLIVRRAKRKCFSLTESPLKPVVFGSDQKNIGEKLPVLFRVDTEKQPSVSPDDQQNIEDKDNLVTSRGEHHAEMIGETEAMNVIDTWTEMEDLTATVSNNLICGDLRNQQEQNNSILEAETVESHIKEIEVSHVSKQLVEVTPIGKLKYINSSGKYVVDLDDVSPTLTTKRKSQKCLFSPTSKNHLTRSAAKRKHENDLHHQQDEMLIKLDGKQSKDSSKNINSSYIKLSVPETIVSSESIDNTCVDFKNDTKKSAIDNFIESSESKTGTEISGTELKNVNSKGGQTKRGLAKKGSLNSDSFVKHPQSCLSPASKAAIKRGIEKPASMSISDTEQKVIKNNSMNVIDVDAEFEFCGSAAGQNKLSQCKSKTDSVCASHMKIVDKVHCSQTSESDIVIVEAQNMTRKNKKQMAKVDTKKVKKSHLAESQQEYDDEKKQLEKELFGQESVNKKGEIQLPQPEHTKSSFMKKLEKITHISGIHPVTLEDDDSDLVFDLGDSTDDEAAYENKRSVKMKSNLNKSKDSKSVVQPVEIIKSSSSQYLTSSPLEKVGNSEHTDMNQTTIYVVDETDPDDEDNMYMWPKIRMKRNQIISDSDSSDQEEIQDKSTTNNTSSSAFSSQSEILSTEQQEALENDVAKLHQQIAEYEAKLNTNTRLTEATQENDNPKMSALTGSDGSSAVGSLVADQDEDSNDLFLSPLSPSPPSRQPNPKPVNRRPALSNSKRQTDQYMKQFQSPGGTIRTKKSLDFTVSSKISQSENKTLISAKSVTELTSLELNLEKGFQNDTKKLSSDNLLHDVDSKNIISAKEEQMDEEIDVQSTPDKKYNFNSVSPIILSQKSRYIGSQSKKKDPDNIMSNTRSQPEKDICLIASGLGRDEHLMLMTLVEKFNMKFFSKFSSEVTHVVMKPAAGYDLVCDRTLKFFQGIAHKCWVVAFSWIADSIQAGSLLPEDNYEILGDTSGGESNLGVRRSRLCQEHLFTDFCFACVGDSSEMPKESLHDLLAACGAVIVDDPISLISKVAKYKLIIRCSDSDVAPTTAELDMFNGLYRHMVLLTVMREWVLDSLGAYKLQPLMDYVINSDASICFPF